MAIKLFGSPATPPVLVKKYGNRRLYDTAQSRYVTLEELAATIRGGADARVVDAKTGADLTQATLTQILIEGRGAGRFFGVPLLLRLVRMGDDALADFLGRYLAAALELYLQGRRGAEALAPYNPFAQLPFAATDALARLFSMATGWPGAPPPSPPPRAEWPAEPAPPSSTPPPPASTDEASIDALRRELAELRQAIGPKPAPKRRARK